MVTDVPFAALFIYKVCYHKGTNGSGKLPAGKRYGDGEMKADKQ
jgi:hypothetical protein